MRSPAIWPASSSAVTRVLGIIGHIVLGIVGALVGGFLAGALFNSDPINGPFDISSIVVSVIGAVITVVVVNAVMGRSRVGRGPI